MPKDKVAVALSGGVDSAVAALLLKEAGYDVIAVHMRLWDSPSCEYQARQAERVCRVLDIPCHQIDLQEEFDSCVVDYFCREYQQGRTPNPCVACNREIKFGFLLDRVLPLGADYLATGHYARVARSRNGHRLLKAADSGRDQSYFLYTLTQDKLGHLLFPVGEHAGDEVERIAREAGLPAATRSSQDVCFISHKNYGAFLSQRLSTVPGDIVDTRGNRLGQHRGIAFYTIGQRHGLGAATMGRDKPLYVIRIEPDSNRIVLGHEEQLYSQRLTTGNLNWISGGAPGDAFTARAKIRYKSTEAEAAVSLKDRWADVRFAAPQKSVTSGQAIVFYDADEVLGGGTIESFQTSTQDNETESCISVSEPRRGR
ncbi:MAG: tRNA 2-thiouridine(34) synthase MnmA [Dehalococcoidia bacterium]